MKALEDIFSSKKQRELMEKYYDACYRQFEAETDIKCFKQALLDTLPIKPGVWFKYSKHSGLIKDVMLVNGIESMHIRYNPKGLEDEYNKDDDWLKINLRKDLDNIQIIPEDGK